MSRLLRRERHARSTDALWRPDEDDRGLKSMHDWYGVGVLVGLGASYPDGPVCWFGSKQAAEASYVQGLRDGRRWRQESKDAEAEETQAAAPAAVLTQEEPCNAAV